MGCVQNQKETITDFLCGCLIQSKVSGLKQSPSQFSRRQAIEDWARAQESQASSNPVLLLKAP